jgi:hypothetical protein
MRLLEVEQNTPEWEAVRRGIPTASEFDKIITPTGRLSKQADEYAARLIDEIVRPDAPRGFAGNHHTERGHELEPDWRDWYAFVTGQAVKSGGFLLRDDGKAGCSPDGLIDGGGGLEIKSPDGPAHVAYMIRKELPPKYRVQVHGSLAISGLPWWDFVSGCPGNKKFRIRIEPDEFTEQVGKAIDEFVERLASLKAEIIQPEAA